MTPNMTKSAVSLNRHDAIIATGVERRVDVKLAVLPLNFSIPPEMIIHTEIVSGDTAQPDLDLTVELVEGTGAFATARLKGATVKRVVLAIRADMAQGKVGRLVLSGRMRRNGVIGEAGITYLAPERLIPRLPGTKKERRERHEATFASKRHQNAA